METDMNGTIVRLSHQLIHLYIDTNIAMLLFSVQLQKILYQQQWEAEQKKVASSRKLQVGNMNRNEKIRTNINQQPFPSD